MKVIKHLTSLKYFKQNKAEKTYIIHTHKYKKNQKRGVKNNFQMFLKIAPTTKNLHADKCTRGTLITWQLIFSYSRKKQFVKNWKEHMKKHPEQLRGTKKSNFYLKLTLRFQ